MRRLPVITPTQLEAVQCPRKFAFAYWGEESGYGAPVENEWAAFGRAVHEWLQAYVDDKPRASAEDPAAACAMTAVPLLVPGALHEVKLEAEFRGHKLAARVDMLHFDHEGVAVGTDWKTGAFVQDGVTKDVEWLKDNLQWNVTAYILGSLYGWPVRLNWVYLDKKGKKLPNEQPAIVLDNTAWMAANVDKLAADAEAMWQIRPPPMEAPIKKSTCRGRGWHCDYIGHCRIKEAAMPSVAEMKADYARRKAGNMAINPREIPDEPPATEAELEASKVAAAIGAGQPLPAVPKGKAKTKADLEAELLAKDDLMAQWQKEASRLQDEARELVKALREAEARAVAPAPETRSTWHLSDLMALSDELASFGITVSFGFKQ